MTKYKTCKHCKIKGIAEYNFPKTNLTLDGYLNYCICCSRTQNRLSLNKYFFKKCIMCNKKKHCNFFDGARSEDKKRCICRDCWILNKMSSKSAKDRNILSKLRLQKDPSYKEKQRLISRKERHKNYIRHMFNSAKGRAKKKNMEFNIELEDIIIPEVCPVFGFPFVIGKQATAPSLDRIDSSKGYIKGNIQVISGRANTMKSDANLDELKSFANWLLTV